MFLNSRNIGSAKNYDSYRLAFLFFSFSSSLFFKTQCQDGGVIKSVSKVGKYYKESRGPCHSDIRNEKTRRKAAHRVQIYSTILKHELTLSHASATICLALSTSPGGATTLKFRGWNRRSQFLKRLPAPWNVAVNLTARH